MTSLSQLQEVLGIHSTNIIKCLEQELALEIVDKENEAQTQADTPTNGNEMAALDELVLEGDDDNGNAN